MNSIVPEIRQTARTLRRQPGFVGATVVTLALGIGANTAIFTLVHALMLRTLPVERPEELYRLGDDDNCCVVTGLQDGFSLFSYPLYRDLQRTATEFRELAAFQPHLADLTARPIGAPIAAEPSRGELVSGNYFPLFGVRPFLGRLLTTSDDDAAAPAVVVMSYATWRTHYGGDASVVGRMIDINGMPATVVGVTPQNFFGDTVRPNPTDFWIPISAGAALRIPSVSLQQANAHWLYVMGRLEPPHTAAAAQAHVTTALQAWLATTIPARYRDRIAKQHIIVSRAAGGVAVLRLNYAAALRVLFAASGLVLLIACANVANLLLSRVDRAQLAVRSAIGASRWQLARHAILEGVCLAILGGCVGVGVAVFGTQALLTLAFPHAQGLPIGTTPSLPILGFAFALSLATGLGFSAAPALIVSRTDAADALRGGGRSTRDSSLAPRKVFLVAQGALSLMLLVTAALLTASLRNLQQQSFGYQIDGLFMITVDPALAGYRTPDLEHLYEALPQRLAQIAGVREVGLSLYGPLSGDNWSSGIALEGRPLDLDRRDIVSWNRVSGRYFQTVGTRLVRGRYIDDRDSKASPHVAVVNQSFSQKYFPGTNPLGSHLGIGDASHAGDYDIVGVVEDAKYQSADAAPRPMFFLPLLQQVPYADPTDVATQTRSAFVHDVQLRVIGARETLEGSVRQALAEINPNLAALSVATFDDRLGQSVGRERLITRLTMTYGAVALALAMVGLYGLTAYSVTRRRGEIGIRIALGAKRANITAMVLRESLLLILIGIAIGIVGSAWASRFIAAMLYGVAPRDPGAIASATLVLAAVAAVAAWVPARRAARLDPMVALRTE